ncbi:MAG: tetratricopeptide repeat protein [Candidatus Korobacteraceae bacterium]
MGSRKTPVNRTRSRTPDAATICDRSSWAAPIILLITFLVYCPALWFDFVYDDMLDIVNEPALKSWDSVPRYFVPQLAKMFGPGGWHAERFYRPVFMLWLRLNDALFGLQPGYWHLAAIAAHLLMTLIMYLLARRLLRDWIPAALAALFFGLHPVHVQVVSWVSVVSESLLGAALLASLLCYATRENSRWRYAGSLILFGMALLVKETAVVFPLVIFAYASLFPRKEQTGLKRVGQAARESLPFLGLSAAYLGIRWAALKTVVVSIQQLSYSATLLTIPSLLLFYVKLMVWPLRLSPLYSTPIVTQAGAWNFILPLLLLLLMAAALVWLLWRLNATASDAKGEVAQLRWKVAVFSFAWTVFLLPALNLPALPVEQLAQDRYVYLPSVSFAILLALALQTVGSSRQRFLGMPAATAIPALLLAMLMAAGTISESRIWASNLTLFTRAVQVAPQSKVARNDLAAAFLDSQRPDEAIPVLKKLLEEEPSDSVVRHNLIKALMTNGDLQQAEELLIDSCRVEPSAVHFYQLGVVRVNLHRPDSAEEPLRKAIELAPSTAGYHFAHGVALQQLGNLQGAASEYRRELEVNPVDEKARQALTQLSPESSAVR